MRSQRRSEAVAGPRRSALILCGAATLILVAVPPALAQIPNPKQKQPSPTAPAPKPTPQIPQQDPRLPRKIELDHPKVSAVEILETPQFSTDNPLRLFGNQRARVRVKLTRNALTPTTVTLGVGYSPGNQGNLLAVPATLAIAKGASAASFEATADFGAVSLAQPVDAVITAVVNAVADRPSRSPALRIFGGGPPAAPPICDAPSSLGLTVQPAAPQPGNQVTVAVTSGCAPRGGASIDLISRLPQGVALTSELSQAIGAATANEPRFIPIPAYRTSASASFAAGAPARDVPREYLAAHQGASSITSNAVTITFRSLANACNPSMSLSVSPATIFTGSSTTATVSLSCALAQDLSVQLVPDTSALTFPAGTFTIPAGQTSGTAVLEAPAPDRAGTVTANVRAFSVNVSGIPASSPVVVRID
jgi:hypothetical protein